MHLKNKEVLTHFFEFWFLCRLVFNSPITSHLASSSNFFTFSDPSTISSKLVGFKIQMLKHVFNIIINLIASPDTTIARVFVKKILARTDRLRTSTKATKTCHYPLV